MSGRRRRTPGPLAVAVVAIALLSAVVFVAFNGGLPFRHGYEVRAVMTNVNALRVKAPVRIAGVSVGSVSDIEPGPGNTSVVKMELDRDALPVHADARIRVRPRLFVEGGFYVALSPGSPSAPPIGDGGTIPLPNTRSAVQLSQLLSTFDRPVRDSLKGVTKTTAAALGNGGADGLRETFGELAPTLRDASVVAQALRGQHAHDLSGSIQGGAKLTGALAKHDDALGGLIDNLDTTARALSARDGALGDGITQANAVLAAAPPTLTAIDRTLPILRRVSKELDPNLKQAPPLINRLSSALDEFETVVNPRERPRAIRALRATLVDLPDTLTSLTALLPAIRPVTDCATQRVVPIFNAKLDDGALSTGQPVWQELAHTLPGVASSAQDFDGNGYSMRFQAGAGPQAIGIGGAGTALAGLTGLASGGAASTGSGGGATSSTGSSPQWLGRLGTSAFNPNASCLSQPLPDLAARRAGSGTRATGMARPGSQPQSYSRARAQIVRQLRAAEKKARG